MNLHWLKTHIADDKINWSNLYERKFEKMFGK